MCECTQFDCAGAVVVVEGGQKQSASTQCERDCALHVRLTVRTMSTEDKLEDGEDALFSSIDDGEIVEDVPDRPTSAPPMMEAHTQAEGEAEGGHGDGAPPVAHLPPSPHHPYPSVYDVYGVAPQMVYRDQLGQLVRRGQRRRCSRIVSLPGVCVLPDSALHADGANTSVAGVPQRR